MLLAHPRRATTGFVSASTALADLHPVESALLATSPCYFRRITITCKLVLLQARLNRSGWSGHGRTTFRPTASRDSPKSEEKKGSKVRVFRHACTCKPSVSHKTVLCTSVFAWQSSLSPQHLIVDSQHKQYKLVSRYRFGVTAL